MDANQKRMDEKLLFVTANNNREQLEELTRLLLFAFPGSVVYQYTDPIHVPRIVFENKVNAVFVEMKMEKLGGMELEQILHRKKPELPVFLLSDTGEESGIPAGNQTTVRLARPVSAEKLRECLGRKKGV